jgi:hypothetical protein
MTTTRLNSGLETEEQSASLASLHVDTTNLEIAELKERLSEPPATSTTSPQTVEISKLQKPVDATIDLSALSTSQSAALREQQDSRQARNTSLNAREDALQARLQRLQERPKFVAHVKERSARTKSNPSKPIGLFKNPFYKYRGGILSRIITFVANLLKLLEGLILRRLTQPKTPTKKIVIVPPLSPETKSVNEKR